MKEKAPQISQIRQIAGVYQRAGVSAALDAMCEGAIVDAMRGIWQRMKLVVEPSAAVPLAALLEKRDQVPGRRLGIMLSGGNADLDHLPCVRADEGGMEPLSEELAGPPAPTAPRFSPPPARHAGR